MKNTYLVFLILLMLPFEIFAQKGRLSRTIETNLPTSCLQLSPDKTLIVVANDTEDPFGFQELKETFKIIILNSEDYSQKFEFLGHQKSIESVNFSTDSKKLVSADKSGTLIIWNINTGKQIAKIETGEWIHNAKFSCSGNEIIAIQGYDKKALLYSIKGNLIATLEVGKQINDFDINMKTGEIYFGCHGEFQIWSLISHNKIKSQSFPRLMCMRFNHKYSQLAIGTSNGDVIIMDTNLKETKRFTGHFKPVLSISFSLDDSKLTSASSDQTARIWNLDKQNEMVQLTNEHKGSVQAIEFITDKNVFMTGGENKEIKIWK